MRSNAVYVSVAGIWEIGVKVAQNRLAYPLQDITGILRHLGMDVLAIKLDHVIEVTALPFHHKDPFDRMMVAQARVEGLTLVTADRSIAMYDVPILDAAA